jgi:hypothetical protein
MGTYDISARPDAVISGRFGGGPYPDVSLYDIAASTISFYFADGNDADPGHVDFGPITEVGGVASDWTIAAAGRFTDYGFSDLLLYDSQAHSIIVCRRNHGSLVPLKYAFIYRASQKAENIARWPPATRPALECLLGRHPSADREPGSSILFRL